MEAGDPERQVDHLTMALGVCAVVPTRGVELNSGSCELWDSVSTKPHLQKGMGIYINTATMRTDMKR